MSYAKALRYTLAVITIFFGILEPLALPYATGLLYLSVLLACIAFLGIPHILVGLALVLSTSEWKHKMISYFCIILSGFAAALWLPYRIVMALYASLIVCLSMVMLWSFEDS